tara:strand:+ start:235 stop:612 length:378 start_codon:yes stop_codon:yes gene_type:complete
MKNFFLEIFTWWSSQTLGTRIYTLLNGKLVGTDADGNKYYLNKKNGLNRWVIYKGQIDASKINADWHDWIHYRTDEIPKDGIKKKSWYKNHEMNNTGTENFYSPKNSASKKNNKSYESWSPESEQ